MIPSQKEIAECYQPLFDYLSKECGFTAIKSEMDEIMSLVDVVNERLRIAWTNWCDVEGCENEASNGGGHYRETGYWSVCYHHSDLARKGSPQPQMKQSAIEREASRKPDGTLP